MIIGGDLASLIIRSLLLKDLLHGGLAADGLALAMFTLSMSLLTDKVRPVHGWGELVLVQEVDIGLGSIVFVVAVVLESNLLKTGRHDEVVIWNVWMKGSSSDSNMGVAGCRKDPNFRRRASLNTKAQKQQTTRLSKRQGPRVQDSGK